MAETRASKQDPRADEDDPILDDGKRLSEREHETKVAESQGSNRNEVIDDKGTKRLTNDPDPNLNWDRAPGEFERPPRQEGTEEADSFTPIPTPPQDKDSK